MGVRRVVSGMWAVRGARLVALLLAGGLCWLVAVRVAAATVTVNTTADSTNPCATDGTTAPCAMRWRTRIPMTAR